jgi:hypothetical protein
VLIFSQTLMKPLISHRIGALFLACFLALPARAGIVLDWNDKALAAIRSDPTGVTGQSSPMAARTLAMMQVAIYDAVNGIDGGHKSFYVNSGAPLGASIDAAAAAAANTILSALYPTMGSSFTTLYNDQMAALPNDSSTTAGVTWGNQVATAILNWRQSDGAASADTTPFTSGGVGYWSASPHSVAALDYNNRSTPLLVGWGNVSPFAMSSGSQFRPIAWSGQNVMTYMATGAYATDYNQVKDLGAKVGSTRTLDQTQAAYFWNDLPGSLTTTGQWNTIAHGLLGSSAGTLREAIVMAALNVALADASISAWDAKVAVDFWRPLTAIAYGDSDPNSSTIGDSLAGVAGVGWEPLLDTQATPEFVSENGAFSGAAVSVLKSYFGDVAVSLLGDTDGDGLNDGTRSWLSLTAAGDEAAISAVYGGISFLNSVQQGQALGSNVTNHLLATEFLAVPEPGSLLLMMLSLGLLGRRSRRRI